MKINKNNYEAYFIDYLEGNLDRRFVDDFIEFLQLNPYLKEELSLLGTVSVEPENILFGKKENLFKRKLDSEKEFDKAAIAHLEGDISISDKQEFESYIAEHPEKNREVALFGKTKLQPDETIVFNKKKILYRRSKQKVFLMWSARVAAILIIAFAFFTLIEKPATKLISENKVVKVDDKKADTPELKQLPVKTQKEDPVKIKKDAVKPTIKNAAPKPKRKSLREDTKGRLTHEDVVIQRIPVEIPVEMKSITASLVIEIPAARMATMYIKIPPNPADYFEERLLVDVVKEKTGLDKFKFNTITKAGLNLVSNISKEKFKYETNEEGKITEYKYNSRLLAFSIPSRNANPK
ncbi:MAG: hypothetical protein L3J54_10565 [Draconibacterium sp.]|nr:hypothetical protein [Draconibacterium sp.]